LEAAGLGENTKTVTGTGTKNQELKTKNKKPRTKNPKRKT